MKLLNGLKIVGDFFLGAVKFAAPVSSDDGKLFKYRDSDKQILPGPAESSLITTSNIGSQSVNYAVTAGSAPANGGTSASCSGNAATATKLATTRTINGVNFDGSAPITITAVANGGNADTVGGITAANLITASNIGSQSVNYAGSSGNADTLDGSHATAFSLGNNATTVDTLQNNTTLSAGIYTNSGQGLKDPSGNVVLSSWFHVINMHHIDNNGFNAQIAVPLSSGNNDMYWRNSSGGTWSAWRKVIDSTSIGSQSVSYASSAGNADTIDGLHSSSLITTSNINSQSVSYAATAGSAPANGGTAATCSGNAATATKLATARTINGTNFDGSANITITAAANGGTSATCSGNAATATKLQTAQTINGVSFDGSAPITITAAANGGNADTIDGKHASDFALASAVVPHGIQMFTTVGTSTFHVPANVNMVLVTEQAGGAGGANGDTSGSGSGGAGQAKIKVPVSVTPNTDITVVVGAGGAIATAGGNSSFGSLSVVGGSPGVYHGAGGAGGYDGTGFAGQSGSAAQSNYYGQPGGNSIYGKGSVAGQAATGYGGGGGGGNWSNVGATAGGTGSQGFVLVEW